MNVLPVTLAFAPSAMDKCKIYFSASDPLGHIAVPISYYDEASQH